MLCGEKEEQLVEKALKDSEFQLILNANPVSRAKVEAGLDNLCAPQLLGKQASSNQFLIHTSDSWHFF